MDKLERLRETLERCDEVILNGLLMRDQIIEDIMAYKGSNGLPILQPEQETKQVKWLESELDGKRHREEVKDVFACIWDNSKRIQARKLFNYRTDRVYGCGEVDDLQISEHHVCHGSD